MHIFDSEVGECTFVLARPSCALKQALISARLSKAFLIDFMLQRCRNKSSQPLPLMLSSSPIALRIAFEKCSGGFTKALSVMLSILYKVFGWVNNVKSKINRMVLFYRQYMIQSHIGLVTRFRGLIYKRKVQHISTVINL